MSLTQAYLTYRECPASADARGELFAAFLLPDAEREAAAEAWFATLPIVQTVTVVEYARREAPGADEPGAAGVYWRACAQARRPARGR